VPRAEAPTTTNDRVAPRLWVGANRSAVRREILAELVKLARRHAADHAELPQTAVEHGRDDTAQRAHASQNVWMEVARVLRSDASRGQVL
jgi:hypothetical protein